MSSFIERNKAWVLPLLGVAALGVIYMNVKMLGPSAKAAAAAPAPLPVAGATPAAPPPLPPPAPLPQPSAARPGTPDLWSDLRALEEPWTGLNQAESILAKGAQPLKAEALLGTPKELPRAWSLQVPEPRRAPAATPTAGSGSAASVPALPPPEVDFLIRNGMGSSAWVGGAGFKVGQLLAGGWRVRRITSDMVEVEGPGGVLRRWTNPVKARTSPLAPPSEAP